MTAGESEETVRRELGARLRAAREWARLEQRTVADHLDVHPDTLKGWESGRRRAPLEQVEKIAEYTHVPMWFFRGGWEGWREVAEVDDPTFASRLDAVERALRADGRLSG